MFDLDFYNLRSPSETFQCSYLQFLFHIGPTQSSVVFIGKCKCSGAFRFVMYNMCFGSLRYIRKSF